MKPIILALLLLCASACRKEAPAYTVALEANCARCLVTTSHGMSSLSDTTSGPSSRTVLAMPGDEVSITATALQPSDSSVAVWATVNGFVHGFEYAIPQGADSAATVSIRFLVPELDRYGNER